MNHIEQRSAAELQMDLEAYREAHKGLKEHISSLESTIKRLQSALHHNEQKVNSSEQKLKVASQQIDHLNKQLGEKREEVLRLKEKAGSIENLEQKEEEKAGQVFKISVTDNVYFVFNSSSVNLLEDLGISDANYDEFFEETKLGQEKYWKMPLHRFMNLFGPSIYIDPDDETEYFIVEPEMYVEKS